MFADTFETGITGYVQNGNQYHQYNNSTPGGPQIQYYQQQFTPMTYPTPQYPNQYPLQQTHYQYHTVHTPTPTPQQLPYYMPIQQEIYRSSYPSAYYQNHAMHSMPPTEPSVSINSIPNQNTLNIPTATSSLTPTTLSQSQPEHNDSAQNRKIEDTPPVPESTINWKSIHNHITVQRLWGEDVIRLENGDESLQMASNCGVSIPWGNGNKHYYYDLTAFCRSHGEIDAKSPHFYRIAPKWLQSVLSYWFRMQDIECRDRDVLRLILTFFHQKNFGSSGFMVYYHWIHRAVHQDANSAEPEHHRRERQSSFFGELQHHLTTKQRHSICLSTKGIDSISTFDGIVAVTFEFEMDRGEGPITTTFTLFSNG